MIRTPFAGGVPFAPQWEPLPPGYGEGCGCGCTDGCADSGDARGGRRAARAGSRGRSPGPSGGLTGAFEGSDGLGDVSGLTPTYSGAAGPLAVFDTPPMKPIGDGTDGKGGGSDGTSGTPEDAAETEAHNDFLLGLGDAVAQGGDAAMDFAVDYLGDDLAVDDADYVEPYPEGWCPVWDANTCGEMPTWVAHEYDPSAQPTDALTQISRDVVLSSLRGEWTDCEREVIIAAWSLLARNFDVQYTASCAGLAGRGAQRPLGEILLGVNRIEIQKHLCRKFLTEGAQLGDAWPVADPLELAWDIAGLVLGFPFSLDPTPEVWLCIGSGWASTLENSAGLYCDDQTYNQDCGVVALASLLLHELTHICFRDLFDTYDHCDTGYLVGNYFLWAATHRYPWITLSPCCGGTMPVPGVDDMSGDWFPCKHGLGSKNKPPLGHSPDFVDLAGPLAATRMQT